MSSERCAAADRENLFLEERSAKYPIPIPADDNVERDCVESLTRPVGRPSHKPVKTETRLAWRPMTLRYRGSRHQDAIN